MKKNKFLLYLLTILFIAGFMACEKDDSGNYITATIGHNGFDFSKGQSDTVNYDNNDGGTILWQPGGADNPEYPDTLDYIWWRNSNVDDDRVNKTKDMGKVDLSSISSAPAEWDQSPNIPPLLPGHVVVAKCKDGYVIFKVVATNTSDQVWGVKVEYSYSKTSTFKD